MPASTRGTPLDRYRYDPLDRLAIRTSETDSSSTTATPGWRLKYRDSNRSCLQVSNLLMSGRPMSRMSRSAGVWRGYSRATTPRLSQVVVKPSPCKTNQSAGNGGFNFDSHEQGHGAGAGN